MAVLFSIVFCCVSGLGGAGFFRALGFRVSDALKHFRWQILFRSIPSDSWLETYYIDGRRAMRAQARCHVTVVLQAWNTGLVGDHSACVTVVGGRLYTSPQYFFNVKHIFDQVHLIHLLMLLPTLKDCQIVIREQQANGPIYGSLS